MSITEKIVVRRDAVSRAPYALLAVIEAAITLGERKAGEKESGLDYTLLEEAEKRFADTQHAAVETLAVVCKEADAFRAMGDRPQDLTQALNVVAGAQKFFASSVDEYLARLEVWRRADVQTGRIRVAVAERIQKDNAISASQADKAASGDPEYTQHKDACADLSDLKDASEYEMKVAEFNLKVALATLDAFTAATRGGYEITITTEDPFKDMPKKGVES